VELIIGIAIWVIIFLVWYVRTYPNKFKGILHDKFKKPVLRPQQRPNANRKPKVSARSRKDFNSLVELVENTCAKDRFLASDAASMVEGVKQLVEMEPASGQIWEAYALDSLETAEIVCDDCRIPVAKTVKKTGVKISCKKCGKWLALKNSKVTLIDPSRADLEEWEK
jgi:hypothetical protein